MAAQDGAVKKKRANPFQYLAQVRQEARKVTWTTWNETWVSTIMVGVLTIIAMLFFWGVDSVLQWIIQLLLSLG
ncbi:MAG: preprotein translocase subunit SecE [Maricaulis sp.]|uniref:preprotein translocase subunit SecE n=1 Tax=Maricaulis sp. TaxID=1486257 RepID=UPI001B1692ED|nr:preprotein translocase subunit SecE [Maricaulis sp.]MBO6729731.1 preprotein translocase subunit SecE [Maricaulis sp.]MBO6848726.1 preprotein translocase subunit SecE [Maricaulis sp.]MBO6878687.1 preprotein translocase subunit SecE [Maricaulis sp.]